MTSIITLFKQLLTRPKNWHLFFLVLLFFYFEWDYRHYIFKYYSYTNFHFEFSLRKYLLSKLFFGIILTLFYKSKLKRAAYAMIFFVILFWCIPSLILFEFMDYSPLIPVAFVFFSLVTFLLTTIYPLKFYSPAIIQSKKTPWLLLTLSLGLIIPFVLTSGININLKLLTFGESVYEARKHNPYASSLYHSYMYTPLGMFLCPFLIVYGIDLKKYYLTVAGVIIMLLLYFSLPHKSIFFAIPVMLFFALVKGGYLNKVSWFIRCLIIILFISKAHSILESDKKNLIVESLVVRRTFFVPAVITGAYFDLYKGEPVWLGHSIFKRYVDYPYTLEPPQYVGKVFYHKDNVSANTGIIGDGYMNFGYAGTLIYLTLLVIFILFVGQLKIRAAYLGMFFLCINLFQNGSLNTIVLTHGLWMFMLLMLFFAPRKLRT